MSLSTERRILPCPKCGEMIYSDSAQCRFCSAPLDRHAAEAGADVQQRVNNACNQAKWIRNAAGAMWVFLVVGMIIGVLRLAFVAFFFLVPVSIIAWQIQYNSLPTQDPDYQRAKRDRLTALLLWLPAIPVIIIVAALSML